MFAAFVDENDPIIDEILHEAIKRKLVAQFTGKDDVLRQMGAIWAVLHSMGVTYSNITPPSGVTMAVNSQHVRFANDSLKNAEANCVDGSVLMAAIFRKIGLRTFLVLIPGHCFLAVDLSGSGRPKMGVETTMVGSTANFMDAVRKGSGELIQALREVQAGRPWYKLVDVDDARRNGIQPLRQIHDMKLADIVPNDKVSAEPVEH